MTGTIPGPDFTGDSNLGGGFAFSDDVALVSYTPEAGWCLAGPDHTYLNVLSVDQRTTRSFGVGECTVDAGDIVLRGTVKTVGGTPTYREQAVTGDDLAAQVPSMETFERTVSRTLSDLAAQSGA